MKRLLIYIGAILLLGGIGIAGYWYWSSSHLRTAGTDGTDMALEGQDVSDGDPTAPVIQPVPDAQGLSTYTDSTYHFSLSYPSQYHIGKFAEGGGDTLVLQDGKGVGMQLVITPFDESISALTPERIKQDLPDLPMTDVAQTTLPAAGVSAAVFKSSGGGFGESIELWFVHGGFLYQASTYLAQMPLLEGVMGTFAF